MAIKVDKELVSLKAHYFLYNAATGPVVPFIPTYAKQLGYSAKIVGEVYAVLPLVGLIAKPLFGFIGDKFNRNKLIFMLFQLVTVIAFLAILFIPAIPASTEFHCHEGENTLEFCPPGVAQYDNCTNEQLLHSNTSLGAIGCNMICDKDSKWSTVCDHWKIPGLCESSDEQIDMKVKIQRDHIFITGDCFWFLFHNGTVNDQFSNLYCPAQEHQEGYLYKMSCRVHCDDEFITEKITGASDDHVRSTYQFWVFFTLLAISWAGMAVVVATGDAVCFRMIKGKNTSYGHQRLWGSLGWGSFSFLIGYLIDVFSRGHANKRYSIGFYAMAILIFCDLFASSKLNYKQDQESDKSTTMWPDLMKLFRSIRIIVFFVWCALCGVCCAMVWNFLFWHLEVLGGCDQGSMKTLQGLVMAIQCFGGEVPFFFLSQKLHDAIGYVHTMSLVLLAYGVRFFLYSLITNPWMVWPIEFLNGLTFGVFFSTMSGYANTIAPPKTEATLQGLVQAIFEGIGVSFGSWYGGRLMESVQGSETFRIFSYGAFACCAIHVVVQYLISLRYPHVPQGDSSYLPVSSNSDNAQLIDNPSTQLATEPVAVIVAQRSKNPKKMEVEMSSMNSLERNYEHRKDEI